MNNIKYMGAELKTYIGTIGFAGIAEGVRQTGGSIIEAADTFKEHATPFINTFGRRSMTKNIFTT